MNRLTAYILREYVKILLLAIGALVLAYLMLDFFEKIRKFIGYQAGAADIFRYFLLRLPRAVFEITPMGVLLGTLLTIGISARNRELVALKSCGVNLFRIATPIMILSLAISFSLLLANLSVVPKAYHAAVYAKDFIIEKKTDAAVARLDRVWFLMSDHSIYNVQLVDPSSHVLYGVRIYRLTRDFALQSVIAARRMTYDGERWTLYDGIARTFVDNEPVRAESFAERPVGLRRTFDDFKTMEVFSDEMTYGQLKRYVNGLKKSGFSSDRYAVDLQGKLALPFAAFITSLIGLAFSLNSTRATGFALSVGISLIVGVSYWIVFSIAVALGRGGLLHPVAAAWFANGLFLALGTFLVVRIRQ